MALKNIYSTGKSYDVPFPVMVDSINEKGQKFENKDMLETFLSIPESNAFTQSLTPDISGYFFLSKARTGARFHLLAFDLRVDRYTKTNVRITAPSMFEAYINGVKETSKTSIEDTLTESKTIKLSFPTQPGTYRIFIKYMSLATNESPEGVKITIEPEDKHSKAHYTMGIGNTRNITIKDILEGTKVSSTDISPNGQYFLLTYTTAKNDGKTFMTKELIDNRTNKRISLSDTKDWAWLPQTNKLYYTDAASGKRKLVVVNPETMDEQVMYADIPVGNFVFTPDEKSLIYTDKEAEDVTKGDLLLLATPEDRQAGNGTRYFLSKYDFDTGLKQRLTFSKKSTTLNGISSDSQYLLYSITDNTPTVRPFFVTSMYKLNLQTLQVETLWEKEGFANSAIFSPDGKSILIEGSAEAFGGVGKNVDEGQIPNSYNKLAFIMDLATRRVDAFTRNFDPSISASFWNPADGMIYLRVTDKDYERVYRYNPKQKQFDKLALSEDVVRSISFARKAPYGVYYGVSASNLTRAYSLDLKTGRSVLIADPCTDRISDLNLSKMHDWSFTASDSTTIDGRYYLPPNFDASLKYPLIVYYYGGTVPSQRMLEAPYPAHIYAALGYVVYVLQPSGAIGYGQAFAARHVNAWGKRTGDDIIEGTKQFVAQHAFVDGTKIGCIGASYGGFMSMYLQTQTDLFAAAVSHAGISSISSYWGEGYWGYTYSAGASAGSYPWNNREMYVDQSPLFSADKIKTPILLLHGTEDTNVPIGESVQMYTALKILGKPVELIQVKGENHGIRDYKKRIEWNYSIYAWFSKWLQNDSTWWDSLYPAKK
jgi:dipeptidyl aminopeptidase/acylaminoacyl peptidase